MIAESGKKHQLVSWINEHSDPLYNYAMQHGIDEHHSKDLVQETFIAAWKGLENYKGKASPRNWLFTILKNKIVDHFRKACNKVAIVPLDNENSDLFFDEEDHWRKGAYPGTWNINFNNPLEARDFQLLYRSCCGKLQQIHVAVFTMKYVDDLDSKKICQELNISSSNYWVILHRAKVQLRACLEKNWLLK